MRTSGFYYKVNFLLSWVREVLHSLHFYHHLTQCLLYQTTFGKRRDPLVLLHPLNNLKIGGLICLYFISTYKRIED